MQTEQAFGSPVFNGPPDMNLTYQFSREQHQMDETIKMNFPGLMTKSPTQAPAPGMPSIMQTASGLPSRLQTIADYGAYTPHSI